MKVFLTGGTGYIGSSLLFQLLGDGHEVDALARSDASATKLGGLGATPVIGGLTDLGVITKAAEAADAIVHLGSPGDATSGEVDAALAAALAPVVAGKPWLHTGGMWVHGDTAGVVDDETTAPVVPPAITSWRPAVEATVRAAGGTVIAPGIVYGVGGGLPSLLVHGPQRDGALLFPGTGDQHWTTVYVDDCASLYLAALAATPGSYYVAVNGENPTVRSLAQAASRGLGLGGEVAPEPQDELVGRLGPLAEALELDQQASGARARADLGWEPSGPSLLSDLEHGSYHS